jgi:hypothetical protein
MILHLNTKYTQMGSSSQPTLRITQNKFNKIKWTHKSQGRQWEIKPHFLARDKVIKSNSQCKDDQYIYIPHDKVLIVQGQEVFGVINFPVVFYI